MDGNRKTLGNVETEKNQTSNMCEKPPSANLSKNNNNKIGALGKNEFEFTKK